ncbi:hypothetical protein MRX96_014715 [Rhipicephalus microplus]
MPSPTSASDGPTPGRPSAAPCSGSQFEGPMRQLQEYVTEGWRFAGMKHVYLVLKFLGHRNSWALDIIPEVRARGAILQDFLEAYQRLGADGPYMKLLHLPEAKLGNRRCLGIHVAAAYAFRRARGPGLAPVHGRPTKRGRAGGAGQDHGHQAHGPRRASEGWPVCRQVRRQAQPRRDEDDDVLAKTSAKRPGRARFRRRRPPTASSAARRRRHQQHETSDRDASSVHVCPPNTARLVQWRGQSGAPSGGRRRHPQHEASNRDASPVHVCPANNARLVQCRGRSPAAARRLLHRTDSRPPGYVYIGRRRQRSCPSWSDV